MGIQWHPHIIRYALLLSRAKFVFTFPAHGNDWSAALRLIDPDWKGRIAPLLANTSIILGGLPYRHWHGSGAIRWFLSQQRDYCEKNEKGSGSWSIANTASMAVMVPLRRLIRISSGALCEPRRRTEFSPQSRERRWSSLSWSMHAPLLQKRS